MNKYSAEQLKEVEEFAAKLMPPAEVAVIVGIPEEVFQTELMDADSEISLAYLRGQLLTKAEMHESIIKLAKQGSSPAQTLALKMLRDAEIKQLSQF